MTQNRRLKAVRRLGLQACHAWLMLLYRSQRHTDAIRFATKARHAAFSPRTSRCVHRSRLIQRLLAIAVLLLAAATAPARAEIYVAGDSLGVGVGMAAGKQAHSVAKESVAITGGKKFMTQLGKVPNGSTVVVSLGTNDAVGGVTKVQSQVSAIVETAHDRDLKVVWLGPPCVFKKWNSSAEALDAVLKKELSGTGVTYVSLHGGDICSKSLRAKDGVHFSMKGYKMMWSLALAASGGTAPAADAPVVQVASVPLPRRRSDVAPAGGDLFVSLQRVAANRRAALSAGDITGSIKTASAVVAPQPMPRPLWR